MIITGNQIKTRGLQAIKSTMQGGNEAIITDRGKSKYAILDIDYYEYLKECELSAAIEKSKMEIKDGNYKEMSANDHLTDIRNAL